MALQIYTKKNTLPVWTLNVFFFFYHAHIISWVVLDSYNNKEPNWNVLSPEINPLL